MIEVLIMIFGGSLAILTIFAIVMCVIMHKKKVLNITKTENQQIQDWYEQKVNSLYSLISMALIFITIVFGFLALLPQYELQTLRNEIAEIRKNNELSKNDLNESLDKKIVLQLSIAGDQFNNKIQKERDIFDKKILHSKIELLEQLRKIEEKITNQYLRSLDIKPLKVDTLKVNTLKIDTPDIKPLQADILDIKPLKVDTPQINTLRVNTLNTTSADSSK